MNLLSKAFIGMDVVDGVQKTKKAYNSSHDNKYDNIMGTKPIKTTNIGGQANALNGRNIAIKRNVLASEEVDAMYKQASSPKMLGSQNGVNPRNRKKINISDIKKSKAFKTVGDAYKNNEKSMINNFNNASSDFKRSKRVLGKTLKQVGSGAAHISDSNIKNGLKAGAKIAGKGAANFGKGVMRATPALAGMAGIGYGTYKLMDKFEKKKDPRERNDLYPKAIGAVVGGAMLANAVAKKNPYATFNIVGKSVKNTVSKIPKNAIKRTGPLGQFAVTVGEKVKDKTGNIADGLAKKSKNNTKTFTKTGNGYNTKKNFRKKQASEMLDFFFEKQARQVNLGQFAKSVLNENVLKAGIESIPYYAAPAALTYAMGRDFRKGGQKINKNRDIKTTVVNIPIEKKAATVNIGPNTEKFIRKGAEGIGRTFVPGLVSMAVGRNIMDGMKKINNTNNIDNIISQDVPKDKARIIIQADKKTSDKINEMFKNASNHELESVSDVLSTLNADAQKSKGNKSKAIYGNVKLAQGIRKKQRMNI